MTDLTPLAGEDVELEEVISLRDETERRDYFKSRPHLVSTSLVERLADEAARLLRVDLSSTGPINRTLAWLAEQLDDDYCLGRAKRAQANFDFLQGESESALTGYEAAIELFEGFESPLDAAITRMSGLQCLSFLGHYERAEEWANDARAVFEEHDDHLRLTRLDFNYANLLFRRDRWEEAAEKYRDAYIELKRIGNPQDVGVCLNNMAVCHLSLHDFHEAYDLYQQAKSFCESQGLKALVAEIDYNLAYLFYLRGEYPEALKRYRKARITSAELSDRYRHTLCALDEAEIFLELNLTSESLDLAREAYFGFKQLSMPYEAGKAMVLWAISLSRQGKWFLALELLAEARTVFSLEGNDVWINQIDLHRALVLLQAGRSIEAARCATDARRGFLELGLQTKAAVCQLVVTRNHINSRSWEAALGSAERAIAELQELDVPAVEYQAHFLLGEIKRALDDVAGAETEYLQAHKNLERVRSHLRSEELKVPLLSDKLLVYERLFALLADSRTTEKEEQAFRFLEKAKARSISDLVAARVHTLPPRSSGRSNLAAAVRSLREQLNWYYRQIDLQEMRGDAGPPGSLSPLKEASREREHLLLHSLGELQATDQELSSLQEAFTVDLTAIRATLATETTMLDYYIADETIFVAVLDRKRLQLHPVSIVSRVQGLHRSLRFQLAKFQIGLEDAEKPSELVETSILELLNDLHSELVSPISHLLDKTCLQVIPHGFLHYVPFHALFDGESFLCDRHEITYSPSATVSHLIALRPASTSEGAAVISPTPDDRVAELQGVFEGLSDCRKFLAENATEEALYEIAPSTRFIHLSSRASFRQDNPMFSSIELGKHSLNLFDLFNLRLGSELFTLTGCGSDLSSDSKGDEFLGLTRGLLYAGTHSVLTTLWNPNPGSVGEFMSSFYGALRAGKTKGQAHREAICGMREKGESPFQWAPFVLIGESS